MGESSKGCRYVWAMLGSLSHGVKLNDHYKYVNGSDTCAAERWQQTPEVPATLDVTRPLHALTGFECNRDVTSTGGGPLL